MRTLAHAIVSLFAINNRVLQKAAVTSSLPFFRMPIFGTFLPAGITTADSIAADIVATEKLCDQLIIPRFSPEVFRFLC